VAKRRCPFWVGYLLLLPFRKLRQHPLKILGPHVRARMKVLDAGCAMGFFSLPMARMVGAEGRVFCVDVQPRMLSVLRRRARRAGLADRMELRTCPPESLGLEDLRGSLDFVLAFAVVHEVPDPFRMFSEILPALAPAGSVLLAEPKGHVPEPEFETIVREARRAGFSVLDSPRIGSSRAVLMGRAVP